MRNRKNQQQQRQKQQILSKLKIKPSCCFKVSYTLIFLFIAEKKTKKNREGSKEQQFQLKGAEGEQEGHHQ